MKKIIKMKNKIIQEGKITEIQKLHDSNNKEYCIVRIEYQNKNESYYIDGYILPNIYKSFKGYYSTGDYITVEGSLQKKNSNHLTIKVKKII